MGHTRAVLALRAALAVTLLAGFSVFGAATLVGLGWLSVWLWVAAPGEELTHAMGHVAAATAVALVLPARRVLRTPGATGRHPGESGTGARAVVDAARVGGRRRHPGAG